MSKVQYNGVLFKHGPKHKEDIIIFYESNPGHFVEKFYRLILPKQVKTEIREEKENPVESKFTSMFDLQAA